MACESRALLCTPVPRYDVPLLTGGGGVPDWPVRQPEGGAERVAETVQIGGRPRRAGH